MSYKLITYNNIKFPLTSLKPFGFLYTHPTHNTQTSQTHHIPNKTAKNCLKKKKIVNTF